jgi:ABC-type antimicrobial peptide transport system permease subunit
MRTLCIMVRTVGEPGVVAAAVRRELQAADPNLPILRIDTVAEQLDAVLVHERLVANLATGLAALAVFVAAIGLYGIVAYSLARRTTEIGIRTALGATRSAIVLMVVRDVLLRTAAGALIGVPAAIAVTRLAASRLYGVDAADPLTLAAALSLNVVIAILAAMLPARSAVSLDPLVALRSE